MRIISLLLSMLIFSTSPLYAQAFRIECRTGSGCNNPILLGLIEEATNEVNAALPNTDPSTYPEGMANSSIISQKSNTIDYANDIDSFIVAIGANAGIDTGNRSISDFISGDADGSQVGGIGAQGSLLLGLHMGHFFDSDDTILGLSVEKLRVFLNLGAYNGNFEGVDIETKNIGIHFRYQLITPISTPIISLFKWNGVQISTGIEYTKFDALITRNFDQFTNGGSNISFDTPITINADVSTLSVPVAVATGFQLGHFLDVYGGGAIDLNFGEAEVGANELPINTSVANANLTGVLDLGGEDSPSTFSPRLFAGLQFNFSIFKVGLQVDRMLTEDVWGLGTKVGVSW